MRLNPEKNPYQQHPAETAPIEQYTLRGNLLPPRPVPVFRAILLENPTRAFIVLFRDDQPPPGFFGEIDGRFDPLADQNQAPIHGFPPGPGGDARSHYFDHRGKNHPFWGHSQPQLKRRFCVIWRGIIFALVVESGREARYKRGERSVDSSAVTTMKMIQPNCRVQFAAEDVDFILSVLGRKIGNAECLIKLLSDEESRDLILDDEALFHALLERRGCLRVSSRFYFYILVRNVFRRSGVEERAVADYVAEVLAEFAQSERARCVVPGQLNSLDYFFEMLSALNAADDRTSFFIRAHIGNYSLFFSGVFPDRIRFRAEARGFPGCEIL